MGLQAPANWKIILTSQSERQKRAYQGQMRPRSDQFALKTSEDRLCVMAHAKLLILVFIAVTACHGQLADYLFPDLAKAARSLTDAVVHQPIINNVADTTGNLLSNIVYGLSVIPFAVGRSLSSVAGLPNLLSGQNLPEMADKIRAEYANGLPNEDARLGIGELMVKYGYPMHKHEVLTEDGYILSVLRIPRNGSVVFLMHGLLGSADDFVVAGPESSLAYHLADEGYDVWLGNARGNKYSRQHQDLEPSQPEFWDFTWHEIGCLDLPAMIDYVLNETRQETLKYVGHSQGTTTFFVMASEKPEYNKKISLMVALSPVAFMSHMVSPLVRLLAPTSEFIHGILQFFGTYEFLPDNSIMRNLKKTMCGTGPMAELLCSNVLFLTCGFGFEQLNVTNLPVIYGHVPSGAATKQLVHYAQGAVSGEFKQFDYGSEKNTQVYGAMKPPQYDLRKIVAPVSLFYSDADWMSHPTDVDKLYNKLGNPIDIYKIPFKPFNHLDFIWAKDFNKLIFGRIKKLFLFF